MLFGCIAAPGSNLAQLRRLKKHHGMPSREAFFQYFPHCLHSSHYSPLRRYSSTNNSIGSSVPKNTTALLEKAQLLEKMCNYKESEEIYKTVIYKIDHSCKEAYDHLINLWGKMSVFGFTHKKMTDLFNQYDKHVKVQLPPQFTQKFTSK